MSVKLIKVIIILGFGFMMTQCQKDVMVINQTHYTVKGKFVKSCNEPIPFDIKTITLDGFCYAFGTISTEANVKIRNINQDGTFEITYQYINSKNNLNLVTNNRIVSGGILLFGIPVNTNVNVGAVYIQNNHSAVIKLNAESTITELDTFYYQMEDNLTRETKYDFAVGPLALGQIIDTLYYTKPQVFNKTIIDNQCYLNSNATLRYKIGLNGTVKTVNALVEPCVLSNILEIDLQ